MNKVYRANLNISFRDLEELLGLKDDSIRMVKQANADELVITHSDKDNGASEHTRGMVYVNHRYQKRPWQIPDDFKIINIKGRGQVISIPAWAWKKHYHIGSLVLHQDQLYEIKQIEKGYLNHSNALIVSKQPNPELDREMKEAGYNNDN